jgi:Nucleotidyltransferase of unknown function (DUF6036)
MVFLMANIFNDDFRDFIQALNNNEVDYILIGGYAVIVHGYPRTTGDMDVWVHKTKRNYQKLVRAFLEFGMPVFDMTEKNFLHNPNMDVFTFGVPPVSIDLMTQPKGLNFEDAFAKAILRELEGMQIRVIHINDRLEQKKTSNRPKDQDDIEHLSS